MLDHHAWCQAAGLVLPPGGAISGPSAAYLYGADVLGQDPPVEVTTGAVIGLDALLHRGERVTFQRDVARLNALRAAGWTILPFTAADVRRHPDRVLAQVIAVLRDLAA